MIIELAIYRSALELISQYEEDALAEAMTRMDRNWVADNEREMQIWRRIANTIHMIQNSRRGPDETIH
jgi:hypothetical protein